MTYGVRVTGSEPVELCDECGFDAREVRRLVPELVGAFTELREQEQRPHFCDRPEPDVFSGAEYAQHAVQIANTLTDLVESTLGRALTPAAGDLLTAARRVEELTLTLSAEEWEAPVDLGDSVVVPTLAVLTHLLHDVSHHVWDVRRGLARIGLREGQEIFTVER
jgi:hypothetical protein